MTAEEALLGRRASAAYPFHRADLLRPAASVGRSCQTLSVSYRDNRKTGVRLCENVLGNVVCKCLAKIGLVERPTNDDRMLGNDFGTPNFLTLTPVFEFSHRLKRVGHSGLLDGPKNRLCSFERR